MNNTLALTIKYLETRWNSVPDFEYDDSGALVYEFDILRDIPPSSEHDITDVTGLVKIFDEQMFLVIYLHKKIPDVISLPITEPIGYTVVKTEIKTFKLLKEMIDNVISVYS